MVKPVLVLGPFLIAYHIIKGEELPAAVIEHPIDDDADTPFVELVHHGPERIVPAEAGVHVVIVQQVILVVFPRRENGVEVDTVDPQLLEIPGVFRRAPQGAAQPALHGHAVVKLLCRL